MPSLIAPSLVALALWLPGCGDPCANQSFILHRDDGIAIAVTFNGTTIPNNALNKAPSRSTN